MELKSNRHASETSAPIWTVCESVEAQPYTARRKCKLGRMLIAALLLLLIVVVMAVYFLTSKSGSSFKSIVATTATDSAIACPDGWIRGTDDLSGTCYFFAQNAEARSWTQSQDYCRKRDSNLASIHSTSERLFLVSHLNVMSAPPYPNMRKAMFLGLSANPQRSDWFWLDNSTPLDKSILDWHPGEPTGYAEEWCSVLFVYTSHPDGALYDTSCGASGAGKHIQFVCKALIKKT